MDGHDRIGGEWSLLQQQWHASRRDWQDAVAVNFEKEYWWEFEAQVPVLLRELVELEDTLDRALRSLS